MFMKWWMENLSNKKAWLRTLSLLSLCIVLVGASGCGLLPNEEEEENLPVITPPTISKKPEYEVRKEPIELDVKGTGKVLSQREEQLYFSDDKGATRIKNVRVKAGDKVAAGDILIELDVEELQKQLRKKRLDFRKQEIAMKEALRTKDEKEEYEFEESAIVFEEARQELVDLEQQIADGTLRAPFAGTIVSLKAEKGGTIKAYESLGVISDTSALVVGATFSKDDLQKLAVGMKATVDINTFGKFDGKVKVMPSSTDSGNNGGNNGGGQNGTPPEKDSIDKYLIVELDKWPEDLGRGAMLTVRIVTQRIEDAVVIPISALRTVGSRTYVQVIEPDGTKREADVEVGVQTPTDVQIVKGLEPGQKVVGR
ncbi:efflux RND transporter periplasmic adaptor subunit [Paenibacillus woosongensis]|uniref:Efflux RND transporter periplasmic adaptor subunit n=1 Tax=Paenibacillus woosongensis TaxID=307580 RepID=A0AA95KUP7_9BACL|nr:efflux RND transporter periplasmic adaptor subunit [Paenibacillus woosongensis]WHX47635.1 efflux RND transporter periplasmic adaptor subunit [Paenibacillus woosongensis]